MVDTMKSFLRSKLSERDQGLRLAGKEKKKTVDLRQRFKAKAGRDYIGLILDQKIASFDTNIAGMTAEKSQIEAALRILDDAEYQADDQEFSTNMTFSTWR